MLTLKNNEKINKNYDNLRTSMESKIINEKINHEMKNTIVSKTNSKIDEDSSDQECSYSESFCSSDSDESEIIQSKNSSPVLKNIEYSNSKLKEKFHKLTSIPDNLNKEYYHLENKMKILNLEKNRSQRSQLRKNMSFSNEETLKIDRDNEILYKKLHYLEQKKPQKLQPKIPRLSSSAVNRRKFQRKVEEDNMVH